MSSQPSQSAPSFPRLALPFTLIPDGETLFLVAGEDIRYAFRTDALTKPVAYLLARCDGTSPLAQLLASVPETDRPAVAALLHRLTAERLLVPGPVEAAHVPMRYRLVPEGSGPLVASLTSDSVEGEALAVLCQETLDPATALAFNWRCRRAGRPWMWVSTGAMARGYVGPVFLPDAGPCLACLLGGFRRLSPVPALFEASLAHARDGGDFVPAPFPEEALPILESLVRWKALALAEPNPPQAVFRLHVLELETREVTTHRVLADPTCEACADARVV
jgi:bacteriocin biosynthesis cyclodehydratase domain-containing protein